MAANDILMMRGSTGPAVDGLRKALATALGGDAAGFASLTAAGQGIDADFDAAIRRWQAGVGLIADGVIGPRCQNILGLIDPSFNPLALRLTVGKVSMLFPATKPANIARYLPYIDAALRVAGLTDWPMIIGALGTLRAETEGFVPISEFVSKFNTPPGGTPFSLYDLRRDIGNGQAGDGARYKGRGFVQLTGKANYQAYGQRIGLPLATTPDLGNAPEVAAVLLALFLADKAPAFRRAVLGRNLRAARKLVNGGSHGLANFESVFQLARRAWDDFDFDTEVAGGALAGGPRAGAPVARTASAAMRVARDTRTRKDALDVRDRLYMPPAISLPDVFPPDPEIRRFLPAYTRAGLILDQGKEGACTGFGLTCVINYLRWLKADLPKSMESVSPRMLYTLARRHDEFQGENYEGSSCRGAIKGWFNHGVCRESFWPYEAETLSPARYGFAEDAAQVTLGVYYRIDTQSITDMQAAIAQHRAVFVSANTHDGWDAVQGRGALPKSHADLPVIGFSGRRSDSGGHAFALIGFNAEGFILQNSWGTDWGAGGFAVLRYLDWLANGMDAWVVSLGVPRVIAGGFAQGGGASGTAGIARAEPGSWWTSSLAYRHSVVLGDDGRVSRYLTEDEQPRKLQQQVYALPDDWFRRQDDPRKRLVLYVHGGLNSEEQAIRRASAMGRYFVGNGCYPLFLVWKTGALEILGDLLAGHLRTRPAAAGLGRLTDVTDGWIEKTIARTAARPIWTEIKDNAALAFADRRGGDLLLDALSALAQTWGDDFELHLIGHSAGAIAIGHLLAALRARTRAARDGGLGRRLGSIHLYAPACTVAFANAHYASDAELMQRLHLDVLDDEVERKDSVGPYRKSLLYLVSNALEADLRTPILGLARVEAEGDPGWDGSSDTGDALKIWRTAARKEKLYERRTTRIASDTIEVCRDARSPQPITEPAVHGGFDNDLAVIERSLRRIVARESLVMPVDDLRGF